MDSGLLNENSRKINDHDVDASIYTISNPPKMSVTSDTQLHLSTTENNGLRIYIGEKVPNGEGLSDTSIIILQATMLDGTVRTFRVYGEEVV